MSPEDYLKQGDLSGTLSALQDQVRSNPADAKLRVFLFQLLCVQGDWHRALTQLNVAGELDSQTFPMVQTYRETLRCEALRDTVFSTDRQPLVLGEPERWIALWLEALRQANDGKLEDAETLREEAFHAGADVTEISGKLLLADEQEVAFEWLADGDTRIGPFFEAIVNGGYYWIPLNRVHSLTLDSPADLRDLVWTPVTFTWTNGGKAVGFMQSRYPECGTPAGDSARLGRSTDWDDRGSDTFLGIGQRVWMTEGGEYDMLSVRGIQFDNEIVEAAPDADAPASEGDPAADPA